MTIQNNLTDTFGADVKSNTSMFALQFGSSYGLHELLMYKGDPTAYLLSASFNDHKASLIADGWNQKAVDKIIDTIGSSPDVYVMPRNRTEMVVGSVDTLSTDKQLDYCTSFDATYGIADQLKRATDGEMTRSALYSRFQRAFGIDVAAMLSNNTSYRNAWVTAATTAATSEFLGRELIEVPNGSWQTMWQRHAIGLGWAVVHLGAYGNKQELADLANPSSNAGSNEFSTTSNPTKSRVWLTRAPFGVRAIGIEFNYMYDFWTSNLNRIVYSDPMSNACEITVEMIIGHYGTVAGDMTAANSQDPHAEWARLTALCEEMSTKGVGRVHFWDYSTQQSVSPYPGQTGLVWRNGNDIPAVSSSYTLDSASAGILSTLGLQQTVDRVSQEKAFGLIPANKFSLVGRPAGVSSMRLSLLSAQSDTVSRTVRVSNALVDFKIPNVAIINMLQSYIDNVPAGNVAKATEARDNLLQYPDGVVLGTWYPVTLVPDASAIQLTRLYIDYQANRGSKPDFYDIDLGSGTTMKTLKNKVAAREPAQCLLLVNSAGTVENDAFFKIVSNSYEYSMTVSFASDLWNCVVSKPGIPNVTFTDPDEIYALFSCGVTTTFLNTTSVVLASKATDVLTQEYINVVKSDERLYSMNLNELFNGGCPNISALKTADEVNRAKWLSFATMSKDMEGIVVTSFAYCLVPEQL